MDFRLWLENIEPIDVKIKQLKDIIDNNDYMTAPKKMVAAGVPFTDKILKDFENAEQMVGNKLQEAIYEFLAHVKIGAVAFDPDLPNKIVAIVNKIKTDLGFSQIESSDESWHFFQVTNSDGSENPRSLSLEKIHFKVNPDNLKQIYDLAAIIRKNSQFFIQFKFHSDEGGYVKTDKNRFVHRRDNFIAYLSDLGTKNLKKVKSLFSGINFDVGQDYEGERGGVLSHTQTKSIELALEMLKKHPNFKPGSKGYFKTTQASYIKNKLGINVDRATGTPPPPAPPKPPLPPKPPKPPVPPPTPPQKLIIQGEKGEETFDNNRIWGREDIKKILPEEQANFFSITQFDLKKSNQGWFLWPMPKLANQTILNGKILTTPTKLNVNDKIGLQGKTGKQIVPFTVKAV